MTENDCISLHTMGWWFILTESPGAEVDIMNEAHNFRAGRQTSINPIQRVSSGSGLENPPIEKAAGWARTTNKKPMFSGLFHRFTLETHPETGFVLLPVPAPNDVTLNNKKYYLSNK